MADIEQTLAFWFGAADVSPMTVEALGERTRTWFNRNDDLDATIRARFGADVECAARGELDVWAETPRGTLALIVLLDQFSRNIHRDSALAYANDPKALAVSLEGVRRGFDAALNEAHRLVFYLPIMHSEDPEMQRRSVALYRALRDSCPRETHPEIARSCWFAERHAEIINRWGRYPHRNRALSRASTPEEIEFLKEPHSAF